MILEDQPQLRWQFCGTGNFKYPGWLVKITRASFIRAKHLDARLGLRAPRGTGIGMPAETASVFSTKTGLLTLEST